MKEFMKKGLLVMTLLMLVVSLAACSSTEEPAAEATPETTTETTVEESTEPAYSEDVQAIIDRGVLRVGVKNAVIGFGYQDPISQEYTGLEIDIANKVAAELGVEVEFTPVTAATRTELLDSGDLDMVAATFTITDERKESWDFTTPYYTDFVTVLVEDASGIKTLADMEGAVIGVSSGSTSARALVEVMVENGVITAEFDKETFDPSTWTEGVTFQQYDDYPTISTALSAGEVDAFCVDKSILAVYNTDGRSYIEDKFSPQDYGIATKKDSGMTSVAEDFIMAWLEDGSIESLIEANGLN